MLKVLLLTFVLSAQAHNVLEELPGCYQVDYSFTELESLKEGYQVDDRVYDVSKNKTVYELFFPMIQEEKKLHFQRILFARDMSGKVSGLMKHHAEILRKSDDFYYDFTGDNNFKATHLDQLSWVRETRYLDDGPNYACIGKWGAQGVDEFFQCQNFAKIPGRESRDMKRDDYNTLQRNTKLIFSSWGVLDRQNNIKTIYENGVKIPLAREEAKVFSIKVDDKLCDEARTWAQARKEFWLLSISVWNEFLDGSADKTVLTANHLGPRFLQLWRLAEKYVGKNLKEVNTREKALSDLRQLISQYVR